MEETVTRSQIVRMCIFVVGILALSMVALFTVSPARAATITVDIQVDETFSIGDEVVFNYSIASDIQTDISYVAGVECPVHPIPPLEVRSKTVGPGDSVDETFTLGVIDGTAVAQDCEARVTILEPEEQEENEVFSIVMDPVTTVAIKTCQDEACVTPAKLFEEGDRVYIDYESNESLENTYLKVQIETPSLEMDSMTLPGAYDPEEKGTYKIYANFGTNSIRATKAYYMFAVNGGSVSIDELIDNGHSVAATSQPDSGDEEDATFLSSVLESIQDNFRVLVAAFLTTIVLVASVVLIVRWNNKRGERKPDQTKS